MSAALLSSLNACAAWLGRIQHSQRRYVGASQLWHLSQSGFMARFSQRLLSRLRRVFEGAATEIVLCTRRLSAQIDGQLRERRARVQRRRQAARDAELQNLAQRVHGEVNRLRILVATPPAADGAQRPPHRQRLPAPVPAPVPVPVPVPVRGAA